MHVLRSPDQQVQPRVLRDPELRVPGQEQMQNSAREPALVIRSHQILPGTVWNEPNIGPFSNEYDQIW